MHGLIRRSHNADITGSAWKSYGGGKYVFTGSTKHIDHLKKCANAKSRSIPVMTENDRILIGRKNSFIQSVSRMVSKAGGREGRVPRKEFFLLPRRYVPVFRQVPFQESFLLNVCIHS